MQRLRNRGNKGDGPPVLSQEFVIQNHADIISCVCMVIFMMQWSLQVRRLRLLIVAQLLTPIPNLLSLCSASTSRL